jgi:hypothetical protein
MRRACMSSGDSDASRRLAVPLAVVGPGPHDCYFDLDRDGLASESDKRVFRIGVLAKCALNLYLEL